MIHLVDTGPLVAWLSRDDRFHGWAGGVLSGLRPPLLTCEAVLSETCFLLTRTRGGPQRLLDLVARGLVMPRFDLVKEATAVRRLLERFADRPMSLADACLVRMSELHTDCELVTLDADFRVYRRNGRQVIPTVMPAK